MRSYATPLLKAFSGFLRPESPRLTGSSVISPQPASGSHPETPLPASYSTMEGPALSAPLAFYLLLPLPETRRQPGALLLSHCSYLIWLARPRGQELWPRVMCSRH